MKREVRGGVARFFRGLRDFCVSIGWNPSEAKPQTILTTDHPARRSRNRKNNPCDTERTEIEPEFTEALLHSMTSDWAAVPSVTRLWFPKPSEKMHAGKYHLQIQQCRQTRIESASSVSIHRLRG